MRRNRLAWPLWCVATALAGGPVGGVAAAEEEAARLDVLIVADTNDPEIGKSVRTDLAGVRRAIEEGVPVGKRRITVLEGAEAMPARILAHYEQMPTAAGTGLLFYYSGHGAWADTGHYLRMNGGRLLQRSRLLEAMQAKRPPLAVVLTDSCSLYVGKTALFVVPSPDPDVFRDLFFRHRGLVDVTAARKGQEAVGDEILGGYFTHALVQALTATPRDELDTQPDGIVTWAEVSDVVAKATSAAFLRSHPRGVVVAGRRIPGQNPHVFDVGTPPTTPIRRRGGLGAGTKEDRGTLAVTEVVPGSPAHWLELQPGDRLVSMRVRQEDGSERTIELRHQDDLERALSGIGESQLVALSVAPARGGEPVERWVRVGGTPLEAVPADEPPTPRAPDVLPPGAPVPEGAADTRTVFYATDRARFRPGAAWYWLRFPWFLAAVVAGALVLRLLRKLDAAPWLRRALRVAYVLGAVALFAHAAFQAIHMRQVSDRLDVLYGGDRLRPASDADLPYDLGTAHVSFPPSHRRGEVERPSPWRGDFFEDPERHMVVFDVSPMEEGPFFSAVRATVESSLEADAFVFVHGYNVGFEEAVLRTAQIAYDLGFQGAPILFSWPSEARYAGYPVDEENVRWATSHLTRFLHDLRARSGARKIHLIAHSMGNRALVEALARTQAEPPSGPAFNQVVLAAPDVDADTFRTDIAPRILPAASRVTLYASSNDLALVASKTFHGYPRAGESGESVVVVDGMDTIDVSTVTSTHSYIADNGFVLDDLGLLLLTEEPIARRPGLRFLDSLRHWILEATR